MSSPPVGGSTMRWWQVGLLLMAALLVRLTFLVGSAGSDDLQYANQALRMSEGHGSPGGYLANLRIGIIAPTALGYRLFGVNTATTIWFTMLCSLLGVLAAYLLGRELFGKSAGFWAGVVYAVLPLDVVEAGILLPDICVAALTGLALFGVLRSERASSERRKRWWFVLAGALVGAAYLCKMTALMTLIILAAYVLLKRGKPAWLGALLAGLVVVLVLEGAFYGVTEGEVLYRFSVTGGWNHAIADGALADELASLMEYPRAMFVSIEEFGAYWYLLLAAGVWAVATRLKRWWVVALWMVPIWLTLEFGIASLTQRTFPAHVPRYLLLVMIPGAALIGAMFSGLAQRRRWGVLGVVATGTVLSSLFFAGLHATLVESTVWNSRQVACALGEMPERPTYVLQGKGTVDWLAGPGKYDLRPVYQQHDAKSGLDSEPMEREALSGSYVVVDHRLIGFARERMELTLPEYVEAVPSDWRIAREIRNEFSGVKYVPVRLVKWALGKHLLPGPIAGRFARTLGKVMEENECVIYEVPERVKPGS